MVCDSAKEGQLGYGASGSVAEEHHRRYIVNFAVDVTVRELWNLENHWRFFYR